MFLFSIILIPDLFAEDRDNTFYKEVDILKSAYPSVKFDTRFDEDKQDWMIIISSRGIEHKLYWAEGRYVSEEQWDTKESYRRLLYRFPDSLPDPKTFSRNQKDRITQFSSPNNRANGPTTNTSLFDAIYDCHTRLDVEQHIRTIYFLGFNIRAHEGLKQPLDNVQKKLVLIAKGDKEVADFIDELESGSSYSWRTIRDTSGKSFHSMGLAIDLLPIGWQGKVLYWNWEKNKGNSDWMATPLSKRWIPPQKVIDIFESEGFIWGGYWPIWDNMHFEYRPELLLWRDYLNKN